MDPWLTAQNSEGEEKPTLTFEDNFEPSDRLPDSMAYLSALEKRLARLKERHSKKDLVQSLEEKHKSCMWRLVSEESNMTFTKEDLHLDAPVNSGHPAQAWMRRIAPERQAVSLGELVELLKADQLAQILSDEASDSQSSN